MGRLSCLVQMLRADNRVEIARAAVGDVRSSEFSSTFLSNESQVAILGEFKHTGESSNSQNLFACPTTLLYVQYVVVGDIIAILCRFVLKHA